MKSKMSIKSIVIITIIAIISSFFINMSLAANTAKIKVETANLREKMEEDSKIIEQLSMGDEVEILEKTDNWYKVQTLGLTGYLRQDLITVNQETEQEETNSTTSNTETENETTQNQAENEAEKTQQEQESDETVKNQEETQIPEEKKNESELELGKQKVIENTKLKIIPVINATNTSEVKKEEEVNVVEIMNGWACIETKSAKGWIRKEKLQKQEQQPEQVVSAQPTEPTAEPTTPEQPAEKPVSKTLYVNTTARVNVRKEASTTAEIVTKVTTNTAVEVLEEANGWSKVKVNGKEGYISSSLLSATKKQEETSRSKSTPRKATTTTTTTNNATTQPTTPATQEATVPQTAPVSGNGEAVVAYAKQFIGTKYTYGGSSPATGFDCSGFTTYVYKHFGVSLPRTSGGQASAGVAVNRSNLVAGDLVIYSGHVAIYVGGGQVIHAPRAGKTVCIVPLGQAASKYLGARRVI